MESKRRMTLQQIDNVHSSLPVPSSILKKPAGGMLPMRQSMAGVSRQSLAPQRAQKSLMDSSSGFNTSIIAHQSASRGDAHRSTSNSFAGNSSMRHSYAQPPGSVRRSNTYHRQSSIGGFLPPGVLSGTSTKIKEPRPVKTKEFKELCARNIQTYLMHSGYPHPVSQKTLTNPIKTDFENMFKYLYNNIDPGYQFQKKVEEEVLPLMKGLKYPFADSITKSSLQAVGSMTTWPAMLVMLNWMVELNICMDKLQSGELENKGDVPSDERIFFDYLTQAYKVFLAGDDDFEEMEKELADNFDRKNDQTIKENDRLERENDVLQKQLSNLQESPLDKLEQEHQVLQSDKEKFLQYINHLETKKTKLREMNERIQEELKSKELELQRLVAEKAELQAQVDAQQISPADVDRMTSEREQLSKSLDAVNAKIEAVSNTAWEREIAVQKKLDAVERILQDYHSLGYRLGLIPRTAPHAKGVNFELDINPGAPRPENMLSADLRGVIRPALITLRRETTEQVHELQDESLSLQETLDKLEESVVDRKDELEGNEARVNSLVEQYNEVKEAMSLEAAASSAEMEKLEHELSSMKTAAQAGLLAVEQRSQIVNIEYDQLVHNSNSVKEDFAKEVIRMLDEVIKFKLHVQNELEDLEELVQTEAKEGPGMSVSG